MTNLTALMTPRDDGHLGDALIISAVTGSLCNLGFKAFPHIYMAEADYVTVGGASVPITDFEFAYEANSKYYLDGMFMVATSVATSGVQFALDCSTSITTVAMVGVTQLTKAGAGTVFHCYGDNTYVGTTSGLHTANAICPVIFSGVLYTGDNAGTCTLRLKPETGAVECTLKKYSFLTTLRVG